MTFRDRIADWISGGALSYEANRANQWKDAATAQATDAWNFGLALRAIAAMETPGANATVKRMAKTAREALE